MPTYILLSRQWYLPMRMPFAALCQEIEENHKDKIAVIIIDTMARAMVGTDENSAKICLRLYTSATILGSSLIAR